jgi:hypothetical protein
MVVEGVIVNGRVELVLPAGWPEGARVRVALAEPDDSDLADFDPGPPTETREEILESLRKEIADIEAGIPGMTVEEAMAEVDAELRKLAAETGT